MIMTEAADKLTYLYVHTPQTHLLNQLRESMGNINTGISESISERTHFSLVTTAQLTCSSLMLFHRNECSME